MRKGNYPVVATNHTLILNWNSQTVPLLRQIAINKKEQGGPAYAGYAVITTLLLYAPAIRLSGHSICYAGLAFGPEEQQRCQLALSMLKAVQNNNNHRNQNASQLMMS